MGSSPPCLQVGTYFYFMMFSLISVFWLLNTAVCVSSFDASLSQLKEQSHLHSNGYVFIAAFVPLFNYYVKIKKLILDSNEKNWSNNIPFTKIIFRIQYLSILGKFGLTLVLLFLPFWQPLSYIHRTLIQVCLPIHPFSQSRENDFVFNLCHFPQMVLWTIML